MIFLIGFWQFGSFEIINFYHVQTNSPVFKPVSSINLSLILTPLPMKITNLELTANVQRITGDNIDLVII